MTLSVRLSQPAATTDVGGSRASREGASAMAGRSGTMAEKSGEKSGIRGGKRTSAPRSSEAATEPPRKIASDGQSKTQAPSSKSADARGGNKKRRRRDSPESGAQRQSRGHSGSGGAAAPKKHLDSPTTNGGARNTAPKQSELQDQEIAELRENGGTKSRADPAPPLSGAPALLKQAGPGGFYPFDQLMYLASQQNQKRTVSSAYQMRHFPLQAPYYGMMIDESEQRRQQAHLSGHLQHQQQVMPVLPPPVLPPPVLPEVQHQDEGEEEEQEGGGIHGKEQEQRSQRPHHQQAQQAQQSQQSQQLLLLQGLMNPEAAAAAQSFLPREAFQHLRQPMARSLWQDLVYASRAARNPALTFVSADPTTPLAGSSGPGKSKTAGTAAESKDSDPSAKSSANEARGPRGAANAAGEITAAAKLFVPVLDSDPSSRSTARSTMAMNEAGSAYIVPMQEGGTSASSSSSGSDVTAVTAAVAAAAAAAAAAVSGSVSGGTSGATNRLVPTGVIPEGVEPFCMPHTSVPHSEAVWAAAMRTPYPNNAPLSPTLAQRISVSSSSFVDPLGFGTWTDELNPANNEDRLLMVELLGRLYNRQSQGFYINEIFGKRHSDRTHMCGAYFDQLMLLAKHRVAAFTTPKTGQLDQFDVCYDTPEVYTSIEDYFAPDFRETSRLNGTGGGRKRSKGAPRDFIEGVHYFKSRRRAIEVLSERMLKLIVQGRVAY